MISLCIKEMVIIYKIDSCYFKNKQIDNKTTRFQKFQQLSIQSVTMIGFTVLTVCVLGTGFTINHSINQANKQQTKLSQELLLSQLETSEKYDKVAQKMKEFDYPKKDIVNMYLEN